jgi:hypothetical protein
MRLLSLIAVFSLYYFKNTERFGEYSIMTVESFALISIGRCSKIRKSQIDEAA